MNPSLPIYRGRFALLWHEMPTESETVADVVKTFGPENGSHWDLMLELDSGELLTWRLPGRPLSDLLSINIPSVAMRLPNHRIAYLDYQGPISGNRGRVDRIAFGFYEGGEVMLPSTDCEYHAMHPMSTLADKQPKTQTQSPIPHELCEQVCLLRVKLHGVCQEAEFNRSLEIQLTRVGSLATSKFF